MEVTLSAELQAKRARIAEKRGINPQDLAREAIERVVDYDEWFVREVDKGLAQVATSETLTHEEVNHRCCRSARGVGSVAFAPLRDHRFCTSASVHLPLAHRSFSLQTYSSSSQFGCSTM